MKEFSASERKDKAYLALKVNATLTNIKLQTNLLANSPTKYDSSPKKKKKVKKVKRKNPKKQENSHKVVNVHQDILSGLNSILEEIDVENREIP